MSWKLPRSDTEHNFKCRHANVSVLPRRWPGDQFVITVVCEMKISCTLVRGNGYRNKDEPLPAPKLPRQVAGGGGVVWGTHSWADLGTRREAGLGDGYGHRLWAQAPLWGLTCPLTSWVILGNFTPHFFRKTRLKIDPTRRVVRKMRRKCEWNTGTGPVRGTRWLVIKVVLARAEDMMSAIEV